MGESGRNGLTGYAVQTAVNAGSKLLIFVRRAARSRELSLPFVAGDADGAKLGVPVLATAGSSRWAPSVRRCVER